MKFTHNTVEDIEAQIELAKEQLKLIESQCKSKVVNLTLAEVDVAVKAEKKEVRIRKVFDTLDDVMSKIVIKVCEVADYLCKVGENRLKAINKQKEIKVAKINETVFQTTLEKDRAEKLLKKLG